MRRGFFSFALLEAEAVAVHFEDVDMVGKSVEQGAGEAFGAEDFGPFGDPRHGWGMATIRDHAAHGIIPNRCHTHD
jgi:hypothetical protein